MKKQIVLLILLIVGCAALQKPRAVASERKSVALSKEKLKDKIKGAWAAQTIGVTFGVPVEFEFNSTMIHDYRPLEWNDSSLFVEFRDTPGTYDDIYMDLSFMNVIEKHGVDAPAQLFAESFAHADYKLWFANQTARYNILNGLTPPESGHWLNNPCADDIDFQIEADFAGLMYPGMVNSAVDLCDKIGHIMNYGDGYYGGVFVASLYSLALLSDDPDDLEDIITEALSVIPTESKFAQCVSDVIKWHNENPNDWKATWAKVNRKWSEDIGSPIGVFQPFNIDAKINSAWVVMGLLYGNGDYTRTFEIATRCGDDADCNPATAGGVLAAITGFEKIPAYWKQGLEKVEDMDFMGTSISLNETYEMSYNHALQMIKRNGGEINDDIVKIIFQEPKTIPLEIAFEGHYPKAMVEPEQSKNEIRFEFDGIGFAVAAPPDGMKYSHVDHVFETEMYIDGKLIEKAKLPLKVNHRRFTPFYHYQLKPGKHDVLIKILNPIEKAKIDLRYAVIYGNKPYKVKL